MINSDDVSGAESGSSSSQPSSSEYGVVTQLTRDRLSIEFLVLFVGIPLSLLLPMPILIKLAIGLGGVSYCVTLCAKESLFSFRSLFALPRPGTWRPLIFLFLLLALVLAGLMYWLDRDNLFIVIRNQVWVWLGISLFYSVFSVFPQEFVFRYFFFNRYSVLFNNPRMLLFANAVVFAFAHIIFLNGLVLALTFVGGLFFGLTYQKSRSLLLTCFEHTLYGVWIFTLGMGGMLAFPMMENLGSS